MVSNVVKLANLDDYLVPQNECIKPLLKTAKDGIRLDENSEKNKTNLIQPQTQKPNLIRLKQKKDANTQSNVQTTQDKPLVAQIPLTDCLACSGCVTSAETVLIQQHGCEDMLKKVGYSTGTVSEETNTNSGNISTPTKLFKLKIASISSQSLASLAVSQQLSKTQVMSKLAFLFKAVGFDHVIDTGLSESIAVIEAGEEFVHRYKIQETEKPTKVEVLGGEVKNADASQLPVFVSHCPGWLCYAEKVLQSKIMANMSNVRSSQHIQGHLVKTYVLQQHITKRNWIQTLSDSIFTTNISKLLYKKALKWQTQKSNEDEANEEINHAVYPHEVYHVCVMPCYDKKLEAVRPHLPYEVDEYQDKQDKTSIKTSLSNDGQEAQCYEVDTVLATNEIFHLMAILGYTNFTDLPCLVFEDMLLKKYDVCKHNVCGAKTTDQNRLNDCDIFVISARHNCGSGGYSEFVARYAAQKLFPNSITEFKYVQGPNKDYNELHVLLNGEIKLRFVNAYGFRNMHLVLKQVGKTLDPNVKINERFLGDYGKNSDKKMNTEKKAIMDTKKSIDFVEIMACPGGCLGGGGQVETKNNEQICEDKSKQAAHYEYLNLMTEFYHNTTCTKWVNPVHNERVAGIYAYMENRQQSSSNMIRQWLWTKYQQNESTEDEITTNDLIW